MAAKLVQLSDDAGVTWYTLPGSQGSLQKDTNPIEDTVFGQTYMSNEAGLITWGVDANAVYKGFAGYKVTIKKQGSSTPMVAEAMTLVSGKRYRVTAAARQIWDRAATWVVYDGGIDHTADVISYNFLFGEVVFAPTYTVTGAVTVDGSYFPAVALAKSNSYNLTQTVNAIDDTDNDTAKANGGFRTNSPGLRTVSLQVDGIHDPASALKAAFLARSEFIIEVNPDGVGNSLCRGFFRLMSPSQQGDVGALEEESLTFNLNVPTTAEFPFAWDHAGITSMPTAVLKALNAFANETKLDVRYLPDGVNGERGQCIVTDVSLSGGLESMNTFSVQVTGDGALVAVP